MLSKPQRNISKESVIWRYMSERGSVQQECELKWRVWCTNASDQICMSAERCSWCLVTVAIHSFFQGRASFHLGVYLVCKWHNCLVGTQLLSSRTVKIATQLAVSELMLSVNVLCVYGNSGHRIFLYIILQPLSVTFHIGLVNI